MASGEFCLGVCVWDELEGGCIQEWHTKTSALSHRHSLELIVHDWMDGWMVSDRLACTVMFSDGMMPAGVVEVQGLTAARKSCTMMFGSLIIL